ncbi:hypothetical protein [Bacillus sp. CGMCC 1.16541]|uniref:hypothetical protein n=1 Tax=Bacillus sp. CGMCC 1.16541 TaxID=2185143 RepID=UPI000D73ED92|nr:hypothetical protein [Bacillus sp. CGMCC 1.16541]
MKQNLVATQDVLSLLDDVLSQLEITEKEMSVKINESVTKQEKSFFDHAKQINQSLGDLEKATKDTQYCHSQLGWRESKREVILRTV